MGSDAENLAPLAERNLLPIRRLSSLIPLRKASRNRYAFQESNYHIQSDRYLHDASPAANTGHTLEPQVWPPKHLRLRTEETPRKEVTKTMATPQTEPPIRFPISPPPEDELRKSQTSSGSSRKRVRSISKSTPPSPNPKAKKLPKLYAVETGTAASNERDFDDWIVPPTRKSHNTGKSTSKSSRPSVHTTQIDGSRSVSKDDRRSTASNKHTPSTKVRRRSSPPPSKSRSRVSAARSNSKTTTPSRSKASYSLSQSRPVTPARVHTPPPPIQSLPPPAPPSPSDDPLLLAGAPLTSRKKSTKSGTRTKKEDVREQPPSPTRRQYSPALQLSGLGDGGQDDVLFDASLADTLGQWEEPDVPAGTDYVVPLNFGSSISSSSAKKPSSLAGSPYPTVIGHLEDGTPITRRQHFTMRSPGREASLAMRMAASVSPKRNEASSVRPSSVAVQYLPDASFGFGGHDDENDFVSTWQPRAEDPHHYAEEVVETSGISQPAQEQSFEAHDEEQHPGNEAPESNYYDGAPKPPSSSPQAEFSHGKRLSERFAELERKLAQEGRSFRFSEIGAARSSDDAGFDTHETKFPDLPSSSISPEKLVSQASSSPEKSITEERLQLIQGGHPEEPAEDLTQVTDEALPEESLRGDTEEDQSSPVLHQQQLATVDLQEFKSETVHKSPATPKHEESQDVEESLQNTQEEEEALESLVEEDSAMQETYDSSGVQEVQDASFISPIQRDASSVEDAQSVHSEIEEEYEASPRQDILVANSTFEQGLHLVNSTFEQDSIVHEHRDRIEAQRFVVPNIAAVYQGSQEEVVDDDVEAGEELEGPSWEDETDAEPLVQIRSNDPVAAARAAAILNLHHEYVQGTPKRRDTSSIANSSRRRSTSTMMTPGGARARYSQLLATPTRTGGDTSQLVATPIVLRRSEPIREPVAIEWTKREWRCLEQCFADLRLEIAQSLGEPDVDPEEIDLDDVVKRFVDSYAQDHELEGEWSWDKIHRRAMALISRQKQGTARGLLSTVTSPTQSIFTPARPSVSAAATGIRSLPQQVPTKSVSTLHAPQYAHLQSNKGVPSTSYSTPKTTHTSRTYTSDAMPPPSTIPVRSAKPGAESQSVRPLPPRSKPYQIPSATPLGPSIKAVPEPSSATKRVWNWMGSFLRGGSEAPSEAGSQREFIPVLPPITDADREALRHVSPQPPKEKERIVPPKEQVQLQHVPTPVPIREPRKLNHKTSSGSVKDRIRSFESLSDTLDNSKSQQGRPFVIKKASTGSLSARSFDMWKDVSADLSRDASISQDISVGSVRSQKSFEGTGFNRGRWRL